MESRISGWEKVKISEISLNVYAGATPNTKVTKYWENGNIPWMSSGEINNELIKFTNNFITQSGFDNSSTKMIPINSVLIALAGQGKTRGKVAINKIELCTNQSLAAIIPNQRVHYQYLYYHLQYNYTKLREISSGDGGRGGLNLKLIKEYELYLPPIKEQHNIGDLLSTWDEAIKKCSEIKNQLNLFKKRVIQKYSIKRSCINEQSDYQNNWIIKSLNEILIEEVEKSKINNQYDILTSTVDDIFLQSEYFNKQIASKDNKGYKILKKNRLVLSPQNAWMGNININLKYEIGIVSPSYKIYKIVGADHIFFSYFVKTDMFRQLLDSNSQTGASIVRKSLKIEELMSSKIELPNLDRQKYLGSLFLEIDSIIYKYTKLIQYYETQKLGLMQQLLTGKIRVNVN